MGNAGNSLDGELASGKQEGDDQVDDESEFVWACLFIYYIIIIIKSIENRQNKTK